ncbi:ornithine decarboxylase [Acinetobacter rudis CIP 110305]|uniref:ornithine decarboxylase n=2 Tax=Acinetobacter rudis TaxID=632955 RepID=S3NMT5_9GAMM|nr:ornithine decarboxylase [Acinetobacter rudis CIP 110305]
MTMNFPHYFQSNITDRINDLVKSKATPFLVLDLTVVEKKYLELKQGFPNADIYYALKANPANEVIERLSRLGSSFDLASVNELKKVQAFQVDPSRLAFGNTIKKRADIQYFYEQGIRLYVTDSDADLNNIAQYAPGSKVFFRLSIDGSETADWPLSGKFGCNAQSVIRLAIHAQQLGLLPYGISFHVGSQQRNIDLWGSALKETKAIFDHLIHEHGIHLKMLNLGGGLPAQYVQQTEDFSSYSTQMNQALEMFKPYQLEQIILEPGRSLVGNAGILVSEVVLISQRPQSGAKRWIYTDVGVFNGLIETLGEAIQYPIICQKAGQSADIILAGPTCDSMDIMYQNKKYQLPLSLEIGDHLYWLSTGAYTTSYSSIEFNGFPPLQYYALN